MEPSSSEHPENAHEPIVVGRPPMTMLASFEHEENAPLPMLSMSPWKMTVSSPVSSQAKLAGTNVNPVPTSSRLSL